MRFRRPVRTLRVPARPPPSSRIRFFRTPARTRSSSIWAISWPRSRHVSGAVRSAPRRHGSRSRCRRRSFTTGLSACMPVPARRRHRDSVSCFRPGVPGWAVRGAGRSTGFTGTDRSGSRSRPRGTSSWTSSTACSGRVTPCRRFAVNCSLRTGEARRCRRGLRDAVRRIIRDPNDWPDASETIFLDSWKKCGYYPCKPVL